MSGLLVKLRGRAAQAQRSMLAMLMRVLFLALSCSLIIASLFVGERSSKLDPARELAQKQIEPIQKQDLERVESDCFRGTLNSIALQIPIVTYPRESWRKKIGGKVTIKIFVNENGDVYHATAIDGPTKLRSAALGSAREARFPPFMEGENPRKCAGLLIYTFNQRK